MGIRLLVTGSRRWRDGSAICERIRLALPIEAVIEGGAPGADRYAGAAAVHYGIPLVEMPAEWTVHAPGWCRCRRDTPTCPAAGPRRNHLMLTEANPTVVVAFTDFFSDPRSGTRHMCRIAVEAGLPVTLVEHGPGGRCFSRDLGPEDFQ